MGYWLVLKNNYVIAKVVWDGVTPWQYPYPHDQLIEDVNCNIGVGYWYEATENMFYVPIGIPPDLPDELKQ